MTTTTGTRPSSTELGPIDVPREAPGEECDVIMKGGITSAVVYPRALCEFAKHYRLHGLGGTSAGAIGAVAGAAAEYGRSTGGFDRLAVLPKELYDGKLGELFIPAFGTRGLFRIMKAATVSVGQSLKVVRRIIRVVMAVLLAYWYVAVLWLIFLGEITRWAHRTHGGAALGAAVAWTLVAAGVAAGTVLFLLCWALTKAVPRNYFGICNGLGSGAGKPGFTDWLHEQVQGLAGRTSDADPLTFGDLAGRNIDLRMMTTCVNLGRPYELPTKARTFYYKESEWKGLFPAKVMAALAEADRAQRSKLDADVAKLRGRPARGALAKAVWKRACADAEELVQLPSADRLPVIVAARLSLSYPLLISAVPLWAVDYRSDEVQKAVAAFDADTDATRTTAAASSAEAKTEEAPVRLAFKQVWFTDGGFSSNFPVHFFDSALPVRPAYIVNLGRFPVGQPPSADELENIQYETSNRWLPPELADFPSKGRKGLVGFGAGAFNTARNWHDNSYLDFPGFRDRIVRVLQTRDEGGLNLNMGRESINHLASRGQAAAQALVGQFTNDEAYKYRSLTFSGWQNHQWVRYRALLSALPEWLDGWQGGRKLPRIAFGRAPSYRLTGAAARTAGQLSVAMDKVAQHVPPIQPAGTKGPDVRGQITRQPNPLGGLHRVPPT